MGERRPGRGGGGQVRPRAPPPTGGRRGPPPAAPPSWEELVRRLTSRRTEPAEVIRRRLEVARVELAAEAEFDVTLVNTSVEDVCRRLVALMLAPAGQ